MMVNDLMADIEVPVVKVKRFELFCVCWRVKQCEIEPPLVGTIDVNVAIVGMYCIL